MCYHCSFQVFQQGILGIGFGADDGASLFMTFRGLQDESAAQGQAHKSIAKELETLVVDPFDEWAQGFKVFHSLVTVFVSLYLVV